MDKIKEKWYYSLIIIPILNLLYEYMKIFELSQFNLLLLSIIIILSYEIFELNKKIKIFNYNPKILDKENLNYFLEILNPENIEENIINTDSQFGYKIKTVEGIIEFLWHTNKLINQFSDNKLNKLINKLNIKLEIFRKSIAVPLFYNGEYYTPEKSTPGKLEEFQKVRFKINKNAQNIEKDLDNLLKYCRKYNYI